MNQRKIGILISYINTFLQASIGFLYVPMLLYFIGKNEYGLYQLMGSVISYFSVMDFGLAPTVVRFYSKYIALNDKIKMENTLAIAIRMYTILSLVILVIGLTIYIFFDNIFSTGLTFLELENAKKMYILLLLNVIFTVPATIFRSVINAHEEYVFLKGIETLQILIQPMMVISILNFFPTAFAIVCVQTVLNIVIIFCRVYYCFNKLKIIIKYHFFDKILFFDIRKLALSSFIVAIVDQLFWKTNQIILGIIIGTSAVAVYSIASIIYMGYMNLSTSISGVFLPKITKMVAKRVDVKELSQIFIKIGRLQYFLLALVLTGFCLFGQEFIFIWAGRGFVNAYYITLIIIIPFTIDLIQNIGGCILRAQNNYNYKAKVYICIGIINLFLAIPLAHKYGGVGAAIASGISMCIGNGIMMNWYYWKIVKLNIKLFWLQIANISIFAILAMLLGIIIKMVIPNNTVIILLGKIVLYTFIYSVVMYRFAFNNKEKNYVKNILLKVRCIGKLF